MHNNLSLKPQDLDLILVLFRQKTLTSAAKFLGVEQSTISRQLSLLEDRLGASLFVRHRRGLTPSPLGIELIPHAKNLQMVMRRAHHVTRLGVEQSTGTVTISCIDAIADRLLAPQIAEFLNKHPSIRLKILSGPEIADLDLLECDIAMRYGVKPQGDTIYTKLSESRLLPFAHPKFLPPQGQVRLANLPLLHRIETQSPDSRIIAKDFHNALVMLSNRMTTCIAAAERGAGVVFLPEEFGERMFPLVAIPAIDWEPPKLPLYLAAPRAVRKLKHVDAVWSWIKKMF
jgi:DNA-binding transcriptional LysR family regulator